MWHLGRVGFLNDGSNFSGEVQPMPSLIIPKNTKLYDHITYQKISSKGLIRRATAVWRLSAA